MSLVWENYSCPKGKSIAMRAQLRTPLKFIENHSIMISRALMRSINLALIMPRDTRFLVHTEKSYEINPKSDCIYHFHIDLDPN